MGGLRSRTTSNSSKSSLHKDSSSRKTSLIASRKGANQPTSILLNSTLNKIKNEKEE
jgi:hypothetical protein